MAKNLKGGYQIVNVSTLTYALALKYLECGKPLLIKDGTNEPYYADSIELVGDDVVIRKNGQTIIIDDENNVTNGVAFPNQTTKKIYCHPVVLYVGTTTRLSMLIFNNSATPFTIETLKTYLLSNNNARYLCNGVYFTDSYHYVMSYIQAIGEDIYYIGVEIDSKVSQNAVMTDFDSLGIFDGVNAIN